MILRYGSLGLFFVSLIMASSISFTGAVIGHVFQASFYYLFAVGLLVVSLGIFVLSKPLDFIIVPTGPSLETDRERADRAVREYQLRGAGHIIVSGRKNNPGETQQNEGIQNYLVSHGVPKQKIIVEDESADTLENVLKSIDKIKRTSSGAVRVGVATSRRHGDRMKVVFDYAKHEGLLDAGSKLGTLATRPYHNELAKETAAMANYRANLSSYGLSGWIRRKK